MELMRKHNPGTREEGFHTLLPHAAEHVDELLAAFGVETDSGLRCWLVELLAEARAPELVDFFAGRIYGDDGSLRTSGLLALARLGTKEARRVLWEARSYTLADPVENELFHRSLKEIVNREMGPRAK